MPAEIIPPGEAERRFRRLAVRRRFMVWAAIVLGVAVAIGFLAVGLIVVAVAALVGLAAWLIFAILRTFELRGDAGTGPAESSRPRIEIITVRGETLDGGVATETSPDRRLPGDDLAPPRV
jgi:hypothetical protein